MGARGGYVPPHARARRAKKTSASASASASAAAPAPPRDGVEREVVAAEKQWTHRGVAGYYGKTGYWEPHLGKSRQG